MVIMDLGTDTADVFITVSNVVLFAAIAVASFRRSLLLSRYPIWRSALIGAIAGIFWILWLIVSWVNRHQIEREWNQYRAERELSTSPLT